jgi:hypothetical protein
MDTLGIRITRKRPYSGSVGGDLFVGGTFVCYSLELPWAWNAKSVSCIPNGQYRAVVRYDHADKWRMELQGVPGRGQVQIHIGNFPKDSKGCVLVGTATAPNQVTNSGVAYAKLKAAFYGSSAPTSSPAQPISVTFDGIMPTKWGDFGVRGGSQSA